MELSSDVLLTVSGSSSGLVSVQASLSSSSFTEVVSSTLLWSRVRKFSINLSNTSFRSLFSGLIMLSLEIITESNRTCSPTIWTWRSSTSVFSTFIFCFGMISLTVTLSCSESSSSSLESKSVFSARSSS